MKPVVLVCGGRDYADGPRFIRVMDYHFAAGPHIQLSSILHGACGWTIGDTDVTLLRGADRLADGYGYIHRIPVVRVAANWGKYGSVAGPLRNAEMVSMKPGVVIAFPGGRGTASTVSLAKNAGIEVVEVKA